MLTAKEIRKSFIDFFENKQHKFIPSAPIVPQHDDSLLFINAGMNQFKDIFMGHAQPQAKRAANSQKCLRVSGKHNDLEEVGKDTYHHTFFEMLGNWSFDDYFKEEAIKWAWELVTEVWGIDPDKLWATVFEGDKEDGLPEDKEAKELWTKVTPISPERVLSFGKKDNFWEMGTTGPCGPCSEIHIDLGPERCDKKHIPGHKCEVNAGCARFIELWNLVFIQFNRSEDGSLSPLNANYIDTGAGLERVTAVLQGKKSNYDTDLFMPIIDKVSLLTGKQYTSELENKTDNAFRVIADHIRALTFAITDGAIPSNEGRGYVIRRILRRASRFGRELDLHEPFLYKLVPVVVDMMKEIFPEVKDRAEYVSQVIESEEESFGRTLDRGIEIFGEAAEKAKKADKVITGEDAFQLYDTYGFPFDLTRLMAEERGLKVDVAGFNDLMEQQRERARAAQKDTGPLAGVSETQLPATDDTPKYETNTCKAKVKGFVTDSEFIEDGNIKEGDEASIILDKTCFYAEAGGQIGDNGIIQSDEGKFFVETTKKIADCVLHQGTVAEGKISAGRDVTAKVSEDRDATRKNHTATHLLQWALQKVVGGDVYQQGSLVGPEYLRFDFTCPKALTEKQIKEIEKMVRQKINKSEPVTVKTMPIEQAKKLGAMALFGEKYGDEVRVVALGAEDETSIEEGFSKEFCGGTHVDNIGSIGNFKIIKEESIATGVRRITALTGKALNDFFEKRSDMIDQISETLKVPDDEIVERVTQLAKERKKLKKKLKKAASQPATDVMGEARKMLEQAEKIDNASVVVGMLKGANVDAARSAIDMIKQKAESAAILLGFVMKDKPMLICGITDDLVEKGIKAGDIVSELAPVIGGGGGGRPQMAQAGGKKTDELQNALDKGRELIKDKLS